MLTSHVANFALVGKFAQQRCQLGRAAAGDAVEQLRPVDANAREGVTRLALIRNREVGQCEVTGPVVGGVFHEVQPAEVTLVSRVWITPWVALFQHVLHFAKIEVRAINVARNGDERRIAEQFAREGNAASGLEGRPLGGVDQAGTKLLAAAERFLDQVAEVCVIDHDVGDARTHQIQDVPHDQRAAAHLQQGLRAGIGQGPHPLAAAGRKDHRLHVRT